MPAMPLVLAAKNFCAKSSSIMQNEAGIRIIRNADVQVISEEVKSVLIDVSVGLEKKVRGQVSKL